MGRLPLSDFLQSKGARFLELAKRSIPADYGDAEAEYHALIASAGLADRSHRGLLQLTGEDRIRFLNGQTTNDVASLQPGRAIYTTFVNAKGKMRADGNILVFADRLWIDVEAGCDSALAADLDKFLIADDVQVENLTARFVRLAVIGPRAPEVVHHPDMEVPAEANCFIESACGKFGSPVVLRSFFGADLFFEFFCAVEHAQALATALDEAAKKVDGRWIGWQALEMRRVELGIPRFGADMDQNTLPPEAGIESRAISYTKGCYIGQEVISRIRSVGRVNRHLAGLKFAGNKEGVPPGSRLTQGSAEVGQVTSCVRVPGKGWIGLGYVKRGVSPGPGGLKGDGFEAMVAEGTPPSNR